VTTYLDRHQPKKSRQIVSIHKIRFASVSKAAIIFASGYKFNFERIIICFGLEKLNLANIPAL
jgi:hypothetical protein